MIPKKPVEKYRFTSEQKAIMKEIKTVKSLQKMFANMGAQPENAQISQLEQQHQALLEIMPTELRDSEGQ